jgi:hypothetical protein
LLCRSCTGRIGLRHPACAIPKGHIGRPPATRLTGSCPAPWLCVPGSHRVCSDRTRRPPGRWARTRSARSVSVGRAAPPSNDEVVLARSAMGQVRTAPDPAGLHRSPRDDVAQSHNGRSVTSRQRVRTQSGAIGRRR